MATTRLLVCTGIEIDRAILAPFDVKEREVVGIAKPAYSRVEETKLTSVLSGAAACAQVEILCEACVLDLFPLHADANRPIIDLLTGLSCDKDMARRIGQHLDIDLELPQGALQYTDRMLLMFNVAVAQGNQIAIYSTGGLDPMGIKRVLTEATAWKAECSSIVFFPAYHWDLYGEFNLFDKVVEMTLKE